MIVVVRLSSEQVAQQTGPDEPVVVVAIVVVGRCTVNLLQVSVNEYQRTYGQAEQDCRLIQFANHFDILLRFKNVDTELSLTKRLIDFGAIRLDMHRLLVDWLFARSRPKTK